MHSEEKESGGTDGMGMGGMIDLLFLASGIYLIYTALMAKKRGTIAANVMLGKNVDEKEIQDRVGFIEYMYRKILLAGVLIILASVLHLVNDYYIFSGALTRVGIGMILLALVIYTAAYMRGRKLYIEQKDQGRKK